MTRTEKYTNLQLESIFQREAQWHSVPSPEISPVSPRFAPFFLSSRTFGTHTAGMVCRHWSCRAERGKVDLQVLEALVGPSGQPWESTQAAPPPRLAPMVSGQQREEEAEEGELWEEEKGLLSS